MYDYTIIGAGIIGTMIARELSKYHKKILILDKENDVANHQTTANSAIIHSGHDPKEGTLKARLCVLGNALYDELEQELHIPLLKTGALVISTDPDEDEMIDILFERALKNGVKNPKILMRDEVLALEPKLNPNLIRALSLPSTKVTYPWEVALSCLEHAHQNGVEFQKNALVTGIKFIDHMYHIETNFKDLILSKSVINASGVFSDQVANLIESEVPYQIYPRKGEYFVLDRRVKGLFNHVIYPIPGPAGKGVLIVPQVHGNILVGPTSSIQMEKDLASTTKHGLEKIKVESRKLSHDIPFDMTIRSFAGIRATSSYEDFYIQESKVYPHFYHVAGIDSPGLTAAPAIAKYLIDEVIKLKEPQKANWIPYPKKPEAFFHLSRMEQLDLIKTSPKHGKIICKCEKITEQEIIHAIHRGFGCDTIKGIKKRARAGAGLCQGGYCEPEVLKIIAQETKQDLKDINYYAKNTPILVKETKVKS
jgi:glycerol-3-phosphate dehydrogenase